MAGLAVRLVGSFRTIYLSIYLTRGVYQTIKFYNEVVAGKIFSFFVYFKSIGGKYAFPPFSSPFNHLFPQLVFWPYFCQIANTHPCI